MFEEFNMKVCLSFPFSVSSQLRPGLGKWREIKSHVTPREVVFEFPGGKAKRVALPENRMVVAVAPYITRTHP